MDVVDISVTDSDVKNLERFEGESLADFAYRLIEDMIVMLELPPGAWISEPMLCERTGIGRTPVREAIVRLAAERLLIQHPRRGAFVSEIDIPNQIRLLEVRRPLELGLAKAAAHRRTDQDVARLTEIMGQFEKLIGSGRSIELTRIDRIFVAHLINCSKNSYYSSILPLYALSRRFWMAFKDQQSVLESAEITRFHLEVGAAVIRNDQEAAVQLANDYLDHVDTFVHHIAMQILEY